MDNGNLLCGLTQEKLSKKLQMDLEISKFWLVDPSTLSLWTGLIITDTGYYSYVLTRSDIGRDHNHQCTHTHIHIYLPTPTTVIRTYLSLNFSIVFSVQYNFLCSFYNFWIKNKTLCQSDSPVKYAKDLLKGYRWFVYKHWCPGNDGRSHVLSSEEWGWHCHELETAMSQQRPAWAVGTVRE